MYFFARAKGRKMATYIYSIQDDNGLRVYGFKKVGETILSFYKKLLGKHFISKSNIDPQVSHVGPSLTAEQQIDMC